MKYQQDEKLKSIMVQFQFLLTYQLDVQEEHKADKCDTFL